MAGKIGEDLVLAIQGSRTFHCNRGQAIDRTLFPAF
jgi:hypothetical protein